MSLAPTPTTAARPRLREHAVHFYEHDQEIVARIAELVGAGLAAGDPVVVIATRSHLDAVTSLCADRRIDARGAARAGDLLLLDAEETLAELLVDGQPSAARFAERLGARVKQLAERTGRPIRAFGEMVDLLSLRGDIEAAIRLEELWNGLLEREDVRLLCAYSLSGFSASDGDAHDRVCALHTDERTTRRARELEAEIERRGQVERELRAREKELSDFIENAAEGIHWVAPDGTILYANQAELDMLGYTPDEYIGHHIANFYVDQQLIGQILQRLRNGETLRSQPATLRCKDGGRRHVQITSNAFFEDGRLVYTRCFTRDISDKWHQRQAEYERDSLLMRAPVSAALLTGPDHVFRLANPLYCEMVQRTDLIGKPYLEAFPELRDSDLAAILDQVFETGQPFVASEFRVRIDRNGSGALQDGFVKLNVEPLRMLDGAVYGVMIIAVDVSELVFGRQVLEESHAERSRLLDALQIASRAKDEFLAMLGHELRNPLSPIVTALQLLKARGDPRGAKEQAIIQRQVDHLIRLVDDLLDVSRITRGKVELRVESVEIAQVLAKSVEMASVLIEQRRHHLTIDVPPAGMRWRGDPTRLAQVVCNLLTNAARYTAPGGQVRLRAYLEGPDIVISVADNGRGMAPDLLPRVFQLFFQGHQGVERAEGGLGIGLALVKNLVELHGGTVEAKSDGPNCGSEFIVRLPRLHADAELAHTVPSNDARPSDCDQRRILIVDDNADAAELLGMLLRSSGHSVLIAHDPLEALRQAESFDPQVALLDIGLPVMDGYELARRLRAKTQETCRLIALTGYGQESDRKRSEASGFDGHLVKPVDVDVLLDTMRGTVNEAA